MNYELALALKNAGFPQKERNSSIHVDGEFRDIFYTPTLSELIEACGYGFRELVLHTEHNPNRETTGRVWMAKAGKRSGGFLKQGHSSEEAVAKLWLELNKK